jgi:murein DD-endopeptidase MepM/ murein hydrolase activator NlpD
VVKRRRKKGKLVLAAVGLFAAGSILALAAVLWFSPSRIVLLFESDPPRLPIPVAGIKPIELVDTFGAPRSGGRHHAGIDIFAARGRTVRSTTRGVVLFVGENRLGGRTVRVLGPGCRRHYYAHLEKYGDVKRGQWIEAGYEIGTVGTSGNARGTPPHLHYAIYGLLGNPVDPYPLLLEDTRFTSPAALP